MEGFCADCKIHRKALHKHHLKPKSEGGTDADGIIYICANCHEDRHGGLLGGNIRGRLAQSPEAQLKRSLSLKEYWSDPTNRAKQGERLKESWKTRDRQKMSDEMKRIWTPERRALHGEIVRQAQKEVGRGWRSDPKVRFRLSMHMKHLWAQRKAAGLIGRMQEKTSTYSVD